MKKIIFSVIALAAVSFANAQDVAGFAKGDLFLSGSLGFSNEKTGEDKSNTFSIAPSLGYFVSENIAIGGRIGYESTKDEVAGVETDSNSLDFSVFGRYYVTPASNFSLFAEANVGYETSEVGADKENGFFIGVSPGLNYFVAKNFSIEASFGLLGYSSTKPDVAGAESTDAFELGLNFSNIMFGVNYRF